MKNNGEEVVRLIETLKRNGLAEKEAMVYIACLSLGERPVTVISRTAELKRSTTYLALDRLIERGLVIARKSRRGFLYRAANPYVLIESQKDAYASLDQCLPELLALSRSVGQPPRIKILHGEQEIDSYWEDCLSAKGDIYYWADSRLTNAAPKLVSGFKTDGASLHSDSEEIHAYVRRRVEKEIWVRGIIPYDPNEQRLKRQGLFEIQNHYLQLKKKGAAELREFYLVSRDKFPLPYELSIYNNKVAVVSYMEAMVMIIENKEMSESLRGIFQMAFHFARATENEILSVEHRKFFSI